MSKEVDHVKILTDIFCEVLPKCTDYDRAAEKLEEEIKRKQEEIQACEEFLKEPESNKFGVIFKCDIRANLSRLKRELESHQNVRKKLCN